MENWFSRYLKKLFAQYKESLGNKNLNFADSSVKLAFYNWIQEYQILLEEYRLFLKKYGIICPSNSVVEIGKGNFDSISKTDEYMVLMTPFNSTFDDAGLRTIINGNLCLLEEYPRIQAIHSSRGVIVTNISYFLTQNPYSEKETMLKLAAIHEQKYNICLGMFGKRKDHDIDAKMECLENFSTNVGGKLRTSRNGDSYLGLVYTNDKFKKTF